MCLSMEEHCSWWDCDTGVHKSSEWGCSHILRSKTSFSFVQFTLRCYFTEFCLIFPQKAPFSMFLSVWSLANCKAVAQLLSWKLESANNLQTVYCIFHFNCWVNMVKFIYSFMCIERLYISTMHCWFHISVCRQRWQSTMYCLSQRLKRRQNVTLCH